MKWTIKVSKAPKLGELLVVAKYAWLPTKVRNSWIWLEGYTVLLEYSRVSKTNFNLRPVPTQFNRYYVVEEWTPIDRGYPNEDLIAIHKAKEAEYLRDLNARGGFTFKQWLDKPDDLSMEDYLSGVSSTKRGDV